VEGLLRVVALIAIHADKQHVVLVIKRGNLQFPGGKCDHGETEENALYRECREEIPGMQIISPLRYWKEFDPQYGSGYLFGMVAYFAEVEGDVNVPRCESENVKEALWWQVDGDMSELMPVTREAIEELLRNGLLVKSV